MRSDKTCHNQKQQTNLRVLFSIVGCMYCLFLCSSLGTCWL